MKKRAAQDRPTLDLMEEAVHLVRSAPSHFFAWYLLGVLPFLLALLYFWTDMSWSAVAFQHRAEASLGVALLFLWMKCGQAIFCRKLRARLSGREDEPVTAREIFRLAVYQSVIQPSKLFLLPIAALATIPFGWVWAFYENATALGRGESAREFIRRAWRQAGYWPRQNHGVILIYLLLLGVVFLNVAIIAFLLPQLLRIFTGVETSFTQSPSSFMNTTSLAVSGGLTYLVCDPLLKAIYTLRCFQGDSLHSGEDLAAELRALPRLGPLVALLTVFCCLAPLAAAPPPGSSPAPGISAVEMNRAIDEAMKAPRFSWRLPRQTEAPEVKRKWPFVDALGRFFKATGRFVRRAARAIARWIDKLFSPRIPLPESPSAAHWQVSSRNWMVAVLILLGLAALGLVVQTVRQLRLRRKTPAPVASSLVKPDLADENVSADLLPEDEWLALAREHLGKGELRFALRAFFFAGLAHLGSKEMLALARHKSNRDYWRELRRKASDQPPLLQAFGENVAAIERVWYGEHQIDQTGLEHFENNLEAIRQC